MIQKIKIGNNVALGVNLELQNANLIVIRAKKGYIMCGYLNMETANNLGDVAAKVKDVKNVDEILKAKVVEVSEKAKEIGIKEGMTGKETLEKMF
ncbi:MAG: DUF1805 domain-containing protein [Candidatus Thermoplasmatota archaeon]|nr:DUF1805 domain-containing protein [archaeon]MBU2565154.1 DUF1805 domain-containing protein [Candidatus Thermoplasmatota archaeon]MBU3901848.1 DUF1805 domain-containing protein [Candidatus Thermoplasmatota archaeon]